MAIRRNDRRRLARLALPLAYARRDEVMRRVETRESLAFYERLCVLLQLEGIDPESTCVVDRLRAVQAWLTAIPDTPELRKADEAYLARVDTLWIDEEWRRGRRYRPPPREEKTFDSEVERLIGRYRSDIREIDPATKSPMELYAWCLSRHGATIDEAMENVAKAAENVAEAAENIAEAAENLLLSGHASPGGFASSDAEGDDFAEQHQ